MNRAGKLASIHAGSGCFWRWNRSGVILRVVGLFERT